MSNCWPISWIASQKTRATIVCFTGHDSWYADMLICYKAQGDKQGIQMFSKRLVYVLINWKSIHLSIGLLLISLQWLGHDSIKSVCTKRHMKLLQVNNLWISINLQNPTEGIIYEIIDLFIIFILFAIKAVWHKFIFDIAYWATQ
jgi:hypothetical protein